MSDRGLSLTMISIDPHRSTGVDQDDQKRRRRPVLKSSTWKQALRRRDGRTDGRTRVCVYVSYDSNKYLSATGTWFGPVRSGQSLLAELKARSTERDGLCQGDRQTGRNTHVDRWTYNLSQFAEASCRYRPWRHWHSCAQWPTFSNNSATPPYVGVVDNSADTPHESWFWSDNMGPSSIACYCSMLLFSDSYRSAVG